MIHRMGAPADPDAEPMPEQRRADARQGAAPLPRDDERWAYEIKWDGVRAVVLQRAGPDALVTRNGNDITARYPELAGCNRALSMHAAILDGEVVAFDAEGRPSVRRAAGPHAPDARVAGQAAGQGGAGHVHGLRPAVARRALADGPALRRSGARGSRSWARRASAGKTPDAPVGDGAQLLRPRASRAWRA